MSEAIDEVSKALMILGRESPWSDNVKSSDEFLTPLFEAQFVKIGVPNLMARKNFYELADYVPEYEIDSEIGEKLDAIARIADAFASASNERPAQGNCVWPPATRDFSLSNFERRVQRFRASGVFTRRIDGCRRPAWKCADRIRIALARFEALRLPLVFPIPSC